MSTGSMWTYTATGPESITEQEAPAPTEANLEDGQLLLRVLVGGICGSDLPYFKGRVNAFRGPDKPDPLGSPMHEVVGEVVASRDPETGVGTLVVGWASRSNGMAEYIVVDTGDVFAYSSSFEPSAAIMLQPLACVLSAVDALQDIPDSRVAVIGQGPMGILFSHVLRSLGAAHVTGIDRIDRSDMAEVFGVDETVWSTSDRWAASLGKGAPKPDIVIEAVGHQVSTLADAVAAVAEGGQIYYFGIPDDLVYPFPMLRFLRACARLYSGYTVPSARRDCLRRADEYLRAHPEIVEPYLTQTFAFTDVQEAFSTAVTPARGQLKVTLKASVG